MKIRIPPVHRTNKFVQGELAMFCRKRRFDHVAWDRLVQELKTNRYDPNNMYLIDRVRDENDDNVNENAMAYVETLDTNL
jgi:hypothetical protein